MNVKPGRLRPTSAGDGAAETRKLALALMRKALELLDADPGISPLIGAQLQLTIDRLDTSRPGGAPLS